MLGLLHTSPVHVATFDALRQEEAPELQVRHVVAEHLLEGARREGPAAMAGEIGVLVGDLVAEGAAAVLCTCSTISGIAEGLSGAGGAGVPVVRVDRPMAAAAVAARSLAGTAPGAEAVRIVTLAALASTIEPTVALIEQEAARAGRTVAVTATLIQGAWSRFEAGDDHGYLEAVASAVSAVEDADVIVLAQASMAPAADRATGPVPVLSSPRLGFRAAAALAASTDPERVARRP
jgi:hypothetical protein